MDSPNSTRPCKKCGLLFSGIRCDHCRRDRIKKSKLIPLTANRVRELFDYDSESGRLYRKGMPSIERKSKSAGRYMIVIDSVAHQEHRVVWLWHHGEWPRHCVDHIDRNPLNNRIDNLRDVTRSENKQNQLVTKRNKVGLKGVWKAGDGSGSWIAGITHKGKNFYLGRFKSPKEAHDAYCLAAAKLHTVNPLAIA